MMNGLWTVGFGTPTGNVGNGVVVIVNGRLLGGDTSFTYEGTITESNGTVSADIQVSQFNTMLPSVIPGVNKYKLTLTGQRNGNTMTLAGGPAGIPAGSLVVTAQFKSPL